MLFVAGLLGHSVDKYLLEKIYHGLKLALWDEVNQVCNHFALQTSILVHSRNAMLL